MRFSLQPFPNQLREDLRLYFAPAARNFGDKPYLTEVVDIVENSHELIKYFDAGSIDYDYIVEMQLYCLPVFHLFYHYHTLYF